MIYGVALLSFCMLAGSFVGNLIGMLIGLNSDIGGVGFAMLLLLFVTNSKKISEKLPKGSSEGLTFWREMFIPVIIAMTASQNVYHAVSGGALAIVAGVAVVVMSFAMVPVLSSLSENNKGGKE